MSWAVVIELLLKLFGPYLAEWARAFLARLLSDAAAGLDPPRPEFFTDDLGALFDRAAGSLWVWQVGRKFAVWQARRVALNHAHAVKLAARAGGWQGALPALSWAEREALGAV